MKLSGAYTLERAQRYFSKGSLDLALAEYQGVLAINYSSAEAWFGLGCAKHAQGDFDSAEEAYRRAIELKGGPLVSAWFNLGNLLRDADRLSEARSAYEKALAVDAGHTGVRFALAMEALRRGDWAAGWAGYETRVDLRDFPAGDRKRRDALLGKQPSWIGGVGSDRARLLVYAEQGIGDSVQFLRFVPALAERFQVIFALPPVLLPLVKVAPGFSAVRTVNASAKLPTFDCHVSLMSLPHFLGLADEKALSSLPYLAAPESAAAQWAGELADALSLKVGVVWAGNPQHANDRNRSLGLERMSVLFKQSGVTWVSLQKELRPSDVALLDAHPLVRRYGERLGDFGDTAGLIANLDLVIAVDTSVAHLAGALGKPVWVLLPKVADWRWQEEREDSPWYPTARLFRQAKAGEWDDLLMRVGRELVGMMGGQVDFGALDSLLAAGRVDEAVVLCEQIAARLPDNAVAERGLLGFKRGCIALFQRNWLQALQYLDAALTARPDLLEAHCNRATALMRLNRLDEADAALAQSLARRPDFIDALSNLLQLRRRQGRLEDALTVYRRLLELCPDDLDRALGYGRLLRDMRRDAEAEGCWREIVSKQSGHVLAHMNLAMLLLAQGRWKAGWAEFESRWQGTFMPVLNRDRRLALLARAPEWQGEPLAGKRVLIYPEQGAGDTFQFLRFVPALRALGADVSLGVPDNTHTLLKASKLCGAHRLDSADGVLIDYHVPLLGLPHRLSIEESDLAKMGRYLFAPDSMTERWRTELINAPGLKVGVVWAGNPQHANDRNRSLDLKSLAGIMSQDGVTWVSLQKVLRPGDDALLVSHPQVRRYGEKLTDFADTAGLIANLDLVITVDTSVAHLAGAMGKPVWVLLPTVADWRWLQDRDDSPWYPTARLFRQDQAGGWNKLLGRVGSALAEWAGGEVNAPRSSGRSLVAELLTLLRASNYVEMERFARSHIAVQPGNPDLLKFLGIALEKQGRAKEAIEPLLKAEAALPENPEITEILAFALEKAGRTTDSLQRFRRLMTLRPDNWRHAWKAGELAAKLLKHDIALEAYARVCELNPTYFRAFSARAGVLSDMHRFGEAADMQAQALVLSPDNVVLLTNGGVMLTKAGRYKESEEYLRRSIALSPSFAAWLNLGYLLKKSRRLRESIDATRQAIVMEPEKLIGWRNLCFDLNYADGVDEAERIHAARQYGQAATAKAVPYARWQGAALPDRRLRVGLVSGDFINHPVAYFLQGVLEALDKSAVEVFCYSNNRREDDQTARIRKYVDHWRGGVVGLSDEKLAARIHGDGIDILVDLAGHTATSRLDMFARRPAPVQVAWLGYFATTGLPTIDWIIADPQVLPPEEEDHFVEKPWRLPEIYYCFTPPDYEIPVAPLPALANAYVTLGCFNNLTKITDAVLAVWARVLIALPQARLLLKNSQLKDVANREHITEFFAQRGIDSSRIEMEGASSREKYLEAYHRVDFALDPFPYPGGTTSVEGLWMGVPVLTLRGQRYIAHQGETIMINAGLPDWIAGDEDDYVARAVRLAGDVPALARLRAGLRDQVRASPLFDAPRFAKNLLAAWRGMWRIWCNSSEGRAHAAANQPAPAQLAELGKLFNLRRFDVMAQKARGLTERYPDCGEAWKALGVATGASGGDARPALEKAVVLLPDDPDARRNLEYAERLAAGRSQDKRMYVADGNNIDVDWARVLGHEKRTQGQTMRVMLVIAHFFKPIAGSVHSSTTDAMRQTRIQAVREVLLNWAALCEQSYVLDMEKRKFVGGANNKIDLDIYVLVAGHDHLLDKATVEKFGIKVVNVTISQPKLLPFVAHKLMADHKDRYDWYVYSEDDLVIRDPLLFDKQRAFQEMHGFRRVLQPNRYELNINGPSFKTYIDGNLRAGPMEKFLSLVDEPESELPFNYAGTAVAAQRARNPHSGFFMLSREQLNYWVSQASFMDMDCSFVSPLESAATLAILKSFSVFKPLGASMNFLEIEHLDRKFSGLKRKIE